MPTTTTTSRRLLAAAVAGLRGLGVLLVLLGIVAMHQLTGGTHMPAIGTAADAHAAPTAAAARHGTSGADSDDGAATVVPAAPGAMLAHAQAAGGSITEHGGMPLCLAVPSGLAVLALPAVTSAARATPPDTTAAARRDTRPPGRGPPRDLLAQLCVLLT